MLPRDMEGDLAAVDDHLCDHVAEVRNQCADALINLVPPAAEWRSCRCRELDCASQAAISRGVPGALDAEHAPSNLKDLSGRLCGSELRFVLLRGCCL